MTFKVQPASKLMSVQSFLQRSLMMMAAIMAALVTFVACDDDDKNSVEVESVTINQPAADVELVAGGSSITLSVTIEPANATNKTVTWSSSDNTITTVSSGGVVTGLKPGTVTITATTKSGNKSDNITLTVKANGSSGVEGKRIKSTIITEEGGETRTGNYTYNSDGTLKRIDWSNDTYVIFTNNSDGTWAKWEDKDTYGEMVMVYSYDANKKPLKAEGYIKNNAGTSPVTYDFTFENGRKTLEIQKFGNPGEDGYMSVTFEFNYNSSGRTTTNETHSLVGKRQFTRTYNSDGTLQKVTTGGYTGYPTTGFTQTFTWENGKTTVNYDDDLCY